MRSTLRAFKPVRNQIGRIAAAARSSNRTVALSFMLVAASSVSVWATANTPPVMTSLVVSQSVINEGQSVTLTGTFTDSDAADLHSININWYDGKPQQKIQLPAGQLTFTATRTYTDNNSTKFISASVADKDASPTPNDNAGGEDHFDSKTVQLDVKNVAPSFAHNVAVTKLSRVPGGVVVEGDIVDPGAADTHEVSAKWGDGLPFQINAQTPCTVARRHFRCEHTYKSSPARGYSIELTVKDDGGVNNATLSVQFP